MLSKTAIKDDVAAAADQRLPVLINLATYTEFQDMLKIKFKNNDDLITAQKHYEFDKVIFLGLQAYKKQEEDDYELIHKDKVADIRVLKKMGKIVSELQKFQTYPIVSGAAISVIIEKALGNPDSRVLREYRKTLLNYCNIDEDIIEKCANSRLGELDVTGFVRQVPRQYVSTFLS